MISVACFSPIALITELYEGLLSETTLIINNATNENNVGGKGNVGS